MQNAKLKLGVIRMVKKIIKILYYLRNSLILFLLFVISSFFLTLIKANAFILAKEDFNKGRISSKWIINNYAKNITLTYKNKSLFLYGTVSPQQGNLSTFLVSFKGNLKNGIFSLSTDLLCEPTTQPSSNNNKENPKETEISNKGSSTKMVQPPAAAVVGFVDYETTRGVGFWLQNLDLFAVASAEESKGDQKIKIKSFTPTKWIHIKIRYDDIHQVAVLFVNDKVVRSFRGLGLASKPTAFIGITGIEGEMNVNVSCKFDNLLLESP